MPSDDGRRPFGAPEGARACQLFAILLWMHKGLGYIYGQYRVRRDELVR